MRLAERLGEQLVKRGHSVVYGGTTQGCMGRLAIGAARNGGMIFGVIPQALAHVAFDGLSRSEITEDIYARHRAFEAMSDAFIALPGGVGTLAELFGVLNAKLIGEHNKPIIILNAQNAFDSLLQLLATMTKRGFVPGTAVEAFTVVPNISAALRLIDRAANSFPTTGTDTHI